MYAVLNAQGELVQVTGDVKAAVKTAEHVAHGRNVWVDVPEHGYAPNRAELLPTTGRDMAKRALAAAQLPVVRWKDITALTDGFTDFRAAHALLHPYFAQTPQFANAEIMALKGLLGQNYKTSKEIEGFDAKVFGLSITPYWKGSSRVPPDHKAPPDVPNFCIGSNAECRAACLVLTGQNVSTRAQQVKFEKTAALLHEPVAFCAMLAYAVLKFVKRAQKQRFQPFLRLNVYSDIPWERFCPDLFQAFPQVRHYDYTKIAGRSTPNNYDLTFSYSGSNGKLAKEELERGRRVAIVLLWKRHVPFPHGLVIDRLQQAGKVVDLQREYKVIEGDYPRDSKHPWGGHGDMRPLDPGKVFVGLRFKPPKGAKGMDLGSFVVPIVDEVQPGVFAMASGARQSHADDFEEGNEL
jgi:hypothetical protein